MNGSAYKSTFNQGNGKPEKVVGNREKEAGNSKREQRNRKRRKGIGNMGNGKRKGEEENRMKRNRGKEIEDVKEDTKCILNLSIR